MTLSRKLILRTVALVLGLGLLGTTSLWGLLGLRANVDQAREEYRELRLIQGVDRRAAAARGLLAAETPQRQDVVAELRTALLPLEEFMAFQQTQGDRIPAHQLRENDAADAARRRLVDVLAEIQAESVGEMIDAQTAARAARVLGDVANDLAGLADAMDYTIAAAQQDATTKLRTATILMISVTAGIVVAAAAIAFAQYRSIMRPLRTLRHGVRRIARGSFDERLEVFADLEFRELADDFNRMAVRLDELYRDLDEKVRSKSKELVRSERLASVGFLAAGVAHEINNPLNIISGHAELSLKHLRQTGTTDEQSRDSADSLEVIREEAFRCKEIVQKLLSLAQAGPDRRESVSLARVVDEVVSMVRGLSQYRDRRVHVDWDKTANPAVVANEAELKQVLLNLTINALEAVEPGRGEINIQGRNDDGWVALSVRDNGRGMTPDVLENVFEPFFTTRRGAERHGVGLGLSISHAIIEAHGGRITAASTGPGGGSEFTLFLPSAGADRGPSEPGNA